MTVSIANIAAAFLLATFLGSSTTVEAQGQMVKMCFFYDTPSGHVRSDPIIDQNCASGHIHTFYGPANFHPNTTYQDLLNTSPEFSTSPFVENQSLYWHPAIYKARDNGDGTKTYIRHENIESGPYYRWDNSVLPRTETFPPGFRMIAASNDEGATNGGGEAGSNMLTECCNYDEFDEEECEFWDTLHFPTRSCDFLGIALAMPTCWNGGLGDDNDHKNHMAYTTNGEVAGPCPDNYKRRLPQVQLFVRLNRYEGGEYVLSDGQTEFHVDFFNGWKEGTLQNIIDNCEVPEQEVGDYNPPCGCTGDEDDEEDGGGFLTPSRTRAGGPVSDVEVRQYIIDEATDETLSLSHVACEGPQLIPKSWDGNPPFVLQPVEVDSDGSDDCDDEEDEEDDSSSCDSADDESAAASSLLHFGSFPILAGLLVVFSFC